MVTGTFLWIFIKDPSQLKSYMRLLLLLVSILILIGCNSGKQHSISSAALIKDQLIRYPELGVDYAGMPVTYALNRQIKDGDLDATFELHEAGRDNGKIIVLRKGNQAYAIPIFRRDQVDYWKTDEGSREALNNKVNTTFEQELKMANKTFKLIKIDFFFARYLFRHLLLLEESYPEQGPDRLKMPYVLKYKGSYNLILTVFSKDSLTIKYKTEIGCAYNVMNKLRSPRP